MPSFARPHFLLTAIASLLALSSGFANAASCDLEGVRQALPVREAVLAPPAADLPAAPALLSGAALLGGGPQEALALDRVLLRQRLAGCTPDAFAGYVPRTQFDNTPWRFNAGGEGKRFDADEFDAWMKQRGVRIAKGRGDAANGEGPATEATAPAVSQ